MAETKKFLDLTGLQYLWSKISMEDYPNNETLIAVLNAIDETKADKDEIQDLVKKYFLVVETTKSGSDYLLDGITFNEIYEKFNVGNVNMVCHVDGTDYIPLLSVSSSKIIFSGIYNSTSVALDFDTNGVGILTSTRLLTDASLSNYYTKSEVESYHSDLEDYTDQQVAALVNSAPETLDTLGELAAALQENASVVEALDASITNKQDKISDTLILIDTVTGTQHKIQIQNGQLVSFPVDET